jgi:hypothetical protein
MVSVFANTFLHPKEQSEDLVFYKQLEIDLMEESYNPDPA